MVWNPDFDDFPYIGSNNPIWLSYFSVGFKPPTRIYADSGIYPLKMVDLSIVMNGNGILVGGLEP